MTDQLDTLDIKALECFHGRVVRKDLASTLKGQVNVPTYVLEYLLGKYCASGDEEIIQAGLQEVKRVLTEHYVHPDQSEWFKAQVREKSRHRVIDKVKVRLVETEDKSWAQLVNLGIDRVYIGDDLVNRYERLLGGGVWAVVDLRCWSTGVNCAPSPLLNSAPSNWLVAALLRKCRKGGPTCPGTNGWT